MVFVKNIFVIKESRFSFLKILYYLKDRHYWKELSLESLRQKKINSITLNEISITFKIFRKKIGPFRLFI